MLLSVVYIIRYIDSKYIEPTKTIYAPVFFANKVHIILYRVLHTMFLSGNKATLVSDRVVYAQNVPTTF